MKLDAIRSIWPWLFLLSMSIFFEVWARLAYDASFLFNLFNIQSILTFATAPLLLGIGVTFVITGVNIERRTAVEQGQQEINQEDLDVLHEALSSFCGLGTNDVFSIYETEHGIKLDEIPLENIEPLHGRGAEFMDESLKAFIFYCHQPDPLHVSDELVKLYCEALSHSIKDLDQKSFVPQAMATFSAARKAIGIKI